MPFSNLSIDVNTLPRQEELELQPVSPKFKAVQWWNWSVLWIIIAALFTGFLFLPKVKLSVTAIIIVSGSLLLLAVIHKIAQLLSFRFRAFAVREHDIVYQQGWLIRKKEFCPFSRIQHCSVNAGIFERKYGLATLEVFTAGSSGADIAIKGLTAEQATLLKEMIIKNAGQDDNI
ncbi:PH domain-containing protein [Terrimonas rubra]|uniref:PH domain-containing protein n=1 Tax=Terrimonas rubra TaxID=1035890 RepID=A0ABW6A0F7_9BACT